MILNRSEIRGRVVESACVTLLVCFVLSGCGGGSTSDALSGNNTTGPQITTVQYVDVDGNGVDADDLLIVTFDDVVSITSAGATAFTFEGGAETLGSGATVSQSVPSSSRVEIELGTSPVFFPATSVFNVRAAGSINIRDGSNNAARQVKGGRVITDITAVAPTLVGARYDDSDLDGTVNPGDTVFCEFDKPIAIAVGSTVANNFTVAVTSDTFGAGALLTASSAERGNRGAVITLGTSPVLTVAGSFDSATTTAGSASNVQVAGAGTITITDTLTTGAQNVTAGTSVDLAAQGQTRFRTGHPADLFVGNQDASSASVDESSMFSPGGVSHYDGNVTIGADTFAVDLMFVADTANNRVLIFEDKPTGNNADATVVLGQATFAENLPNRSGAIDPPADASTLWAPEDVQFYASTNQLVVADTGNNRVVIFDDVIDGVTGLVALTDGQSADVVVGQLDLVANDANQGMAGPTSRTLSGPSGIHVQGGQLAVADTGNNRVMIWGSVPTSNNNAASTVVGQVNFVSSSANQGATAAADTLSAPEDVFLDPNLMIRNQVGGVLVADTGNNRVLLYATSSPAIGAAADVALGQASLTASAAATTAAGLDSPTGVGALDGGTGGSATGRIWVADRDNHRVMVYTFDPSQAAQPASGDAGTEIGQAAATDGNENRGNANAAASADSFSFPARVDVSEVSESNLLVADRENHRVLDFTTPPAADASANIVHGHGSFTVSTANDHQLHEPSAVAFTAGRMIVADSLNNRVVIYDQTPTSGSPDPDVVVGQANFNQTLANQGGAVAATTLSAPESVATDGTNLVVADTLNNRVLVYTTLPTTDGVAADIVLGQANATSSLPNAGGLSAATMNEPNGVWIEGTQLIVSDSENHRVLVFNNFASLANGASASVVVGQNDFVSNAPNHGDVARSNTLHTPKAVTVVDGALYVADFENNRVLGWLAVPTLNGETADFVIGQQNFLATSAGVSKSEFNGPTGFASDGVFFAIADGGNHRVLLYHQLPRATNFFAKRVVGQTSFSANQINGGNPVPSTGTLHWPRGVFFTGTDLWICDPGNSRVVRHR